MASLHQLVKEKFASAKESKDLFSFDTTQVEKLSGGIDVNINIYLNISRLTKKTQHIKEDLSIMIV
jgi:hypothetical protein